MKLYSKFKDYYDSARGWGIDPNAFYKREKKVVIDTDAVLTNDDKALLSFINLRGVSEWGTPIYCTNGDVRYFAIVFCGVIHYGISILDAPKEQQYNREYVSFYDVSDAIEYITTRAKSKHPINCRTPYDGGSFCDVATKFLSRTPKSTSATIHTLREHDILRPVIGVGCFDSGDLSVDVSLIDHHFYKVFDSYGAFQEISMFVSGVMGGQSPEIIQLSDKDLIAKRGFNQQSFRTRKST